MTENLLLAGRVRRSFGKIGKIIEIPNLIEMQKVSYQRFLQMYTPPEKREMTGLQAVFHSVFPIRDFSGTASLEFVSYRFGDVKYDVDDCIHRGMTYEVPVRLTVRLVVFDVEKESGTQNIRDIKEQEIYFGTIPLMTDKGTFVINGTERVVVSQLHRSSGVFFDHDKGKSHASGKVIYTARIIPVRGSWIDMEIDPKDVLYIRIDRRRKFPATLLFKAFGYTTEDILNYFHRVETVVLGKKTMHKVFDADTIRGQRASYNVKHPETGEILVKKGRLFTAKAVRQMKGLDIDKITITDEDVLEKVFARAVRHPETNEVLFNANDLVDDKSLELLREVGVKKFTILSTGGFATGDSIRKTLLLDKVDSREEALIEIYRRLRPSNPSTLEVAQEFIDQLFFRPSHYDLSAVGRLKLNIRLNLETDVKVTTLRREDILLTAKTLVGLKDTQGVVDDIDHLGNRRVRAVGELLENQYRIGLVRMERAIKERMSLQEIDALMPNDLINPKPVSAVVKEFFGTSQLSQFMDQTNPLSEVTHKRRLSALGPGGLTRERAGFEVRDVHPSHYGRICPIETPEGPNIGLIVSLSTYARVNEYGFIETPYRVVKDSIATRDIRYLSALQEKDLPIAQANAILDKDGHLVNAMVSARVAGEFMMVPRELIKLMDISPNQLVSVSSSMIPFLENDDANRALMGSNMQRQAVPLLTTEAPLIGTGLERVVARDSGVTIVAKRPGKVAAVDASRIVLKHEQDAGGELGKSVTIYSLSKFTRSNQNTCFNHRPIVRVGDMVETGDIIADGPATEQGELALGKNVTVAFMPWGGYNFEDSILVSERLVRDGTFTSVHIEEFEVVSRDTKLGKEEITRDIPNVGEEALKNLDDSGIVRLGAEVKPGDILVGKITPKGETQLSPEEKLLRAIFGEKAGDVKDTSLRVPPGVEGVVVDAKVFARRGVEKDDRTRTIEDEEIAALEKDRADELRIIEETVLRELTRILEGHQAISSIKKGKQVLIPKDVRITAEMMAETPLAMLEGLVVKDEAVSERVQDILDRYREQREIVQMAFEEQVNRYQKGDDLPPGVIKMVKIYVAMKRRLSVGDKMAGRHGNKGVVSCILPVEDMPYFADGSPVEMVLNPLGVPSRMNVGQILEIHLGRAARELGRQVEKLIKDQKQDALRTKMKEIFAADAKDVARLTDDELLMVAGRYTKGVHMATPVFDGAKEEEIKDLLGKAGVWNTGQAILYDGRSGERFRSPITVGTMYMLKLHHLVDDKIHARSIGPYSLVTQQPLGGKAQFGGQRLGEMEVWAMEAYGAAYALQEFLTVKSDDMVGRTRMYEKIVKGQNVLEPGMPESFNVLIKELQSLGLEMTLQELGDSD